MVDRLIPGFERDWAICTITVGLSLKIEEEGRNNKVEGGLGIYLIARLCSKCNNSWVITSV